jgi:hypothetical protein
MEIFWYPFIGVKFAGKGTLKEKIAHKKMCDL